MRENNCGRCGYRACSFCIQYRIKNDGIRLKECKDLEQNLKDCVKTVKIEPKKVKKRTYKTKAFMEFKQKLKRG